MEKMQLFAMLQQSGDPTNDMTYWGFIILLWLGVFIMLVWLCFGK